MTLLGQVAKTSQQRVSIMALADERPLLDLWRPLQSWQVLPDLEQMHFPTSVPAQSKSMRRTCCTSPSCQLDIHWPGNSHRRAKVLLL